MADPPESSQENQQRDVVAAFHASFHFTQGNILDWSITVDDSTYTPILNAVEFTSLPSGLHGVERDVVYFTKGGHDAIAVFWRRKTSEDRGYQMEAFGILLASSPYPRPWQHVSSLRRIQDRAALESYFAAHRVDTATTASPSPPFDSVQSELLSSQQQHPLVHLPHLLRIIGPSFITIFKAIITRRRVLLYTQAPVEPACLLAKACVDVGFPGVDSLELDMDSRRPSVLGSVGLMDIDRLKDESNTGLGWVACTTDALFMERPALYDLIVDLTTAAVSSFPLPNAPTSTASSSSSKPPPTNPAYPISRPALYISVATSSSSSTPKPPKLQRVRFTFSDLRLWTRIDAILQRHHHRQEKEKERRWADVLTMPWRVYSYEDVCLVCAGLWIGDGGIMLEGEDELPSSSTSQRKVGSASPKSSAPRRRNLLIRKDSASSSSSKSSSSSSGSASSSSSSSSAYASQPLSVRTPLLLLDVFHAQSELWLDGLEALLLARSSSSAMLSPQDLASLRLSALSDSDSRFVELLAETRMRRRGVMVRRGWKDLVAAVVGW